ncbi:hypothetical protein C8J57DRAFT_1473852 [Mycena rebaudengoi]|nr:hypothetical protein C8J57DRAFT_1473852 [Mycena rebaudengoi]
MNSPFNDILYTNVVPSDAQCKSILDIIEHPRKEAAALTDEIARLQARLDELTQKRDDLNESIDAHLALVSPARRLPEDVVRAIFEACLPTSRNAIVSGDECPLLLCQICRVWRSLALSTPPIWTSLHVVVPPQSKLRDLAEMLSLWLSRSGVLPLSISLVFSRVSEVGVDASPLLSALLAHVRRWKHVRLSISNRRFFADITSLSAEDAPYLQSVAFHSERDFSSGQELPWHTDLYKCKILNSRSLRSFSVTASAHPQFRKMPDLPWANLCSLALNYEPDDYYDDIDIDSTLHLLAQCPLLERCALTLSIRRQMPDDHVPLAPFSLARLTHLSVTDHVDHSALLFEALILPNLRSLQYEGRFYGSHPFATAHLAPTLAKLESLSLDVPTLTVDTLLHLLADMPALLELRITGEPEIPYPVSTNDDEEKNERFFRRLASSAVCPRLSSLVFRQFPSDAAEGLLYFIKTRAKTGLEGSARLMRVSANFSGPATHNIMPLLQDEISAGLSVTLKYETPSAMRYFPWEGTERDLYYSLPFYQF